MASTVLSFALCGSFFSFLFFFKNFIVILWINNTFSICTDEKKVSEWPSESKIKFRLADSKLFAFKNKIQIYSIAFFLFCCLGLAVI